MHFEIKGGGVMPGGVIAFRKMVEGHFIIAPEKSGSEARWAKRLYLTVRGSMTQSDQRAVALEREIDRTWRRAVHHAKRKLLDASVE
jgi:hypothetical protein